jgi:Protein of unknown function DUF262
MKSGKYTLKELLTARDMEQIIVPEIQRDYVWSTDQVECLLDSILVDFMNNKLAFINVKSDDETITELFKSFYKKRKFSTNIGFIYAYNDAEYAAKYFLIDGQQRLTTLYLLLLALTIGNKQNKEDFENHYFSKSILKLDYKVRESAHDFFQRFVSYLLNVTEIEIDNIINEVKNQYWYFNEYKSDASINSMLNNFELIASKLTKNEVDKKTFYDYIQNYIEFWYFDTSISEQGEELYIFMNARGEQTQANENTKAELLGSLSKEDFEKSIRERKDCKELKDLDDLKNFCGKLWEEWQDFFWNKRGQDNENADNGFNEFLMWVDELSTIESLKITGFLKFELIESYYKALVYLINNNEVEISHDNRKIRIKEIGVRLNFKPLLAPKFSKQIAAEKKSKHLLYAMLLYIKERNFNPNLLELYRFARLLNNAVENIDTHSINIDKTNEESSKKRVNETLLDCSKLSKVMTVLDIELKTTEWLLQEVIQEELFKLSLYKNPSKDTSREQLEKIFWEAEDHKSNKGRIDNLFQLTFWNEQDGEFVYNEKFLFDNKNFNSASIYLFKRYFDDLNKLLPANGKLGEELRGYLLVTDYYKMKNFGNQNGIISMNEEDIVRKSYFLKMVKEVGGREITEFFMERERSILKTVDLENTDDLKLQLFIYFIVLTKENKWDWSKGLNFWFFNYYKGGVFNSFFLKSKIFQHYKTNLVENSDRNVPFVDKAAIVDFIALSKN